MVGRQQDTPFKSPNVTLWEKLLVNLEGTSPLRGSASSGLYMPSGQIQSSTDAEAISAVMPPERILVQLMQPAEPGSGWLVGEKGLGWRVGGGGASLGTLGGLWWQWGAPPPYFNECDLMTHD